MDLSSHSSQGIVEKLKASITDYEELQSLLKSLINIFGGEEEKDTETISQVISVLLGSTVQALPLDQVDSLLLKPFLPLIKNFLYGKLSYNQKVIDDACVFGDNPSIPEISKNLEICIQVLTGIDGLLTFLIKLDQMPVLDFYSAPKNIAEVVYFVFTHCKNSQMEYKDVFLAVRSELMALFQQCHQVQVKLNTLLNDKLSFNCAFEEELQLLVDVLDTLNSMAEVVAELDTMSLVAHWKGFAQLTQTYSLHLRSRLDIARPITYLAANISHQLCNLKTYINAEKKVVLRALKVSSLQLKVLIKLCDQYKGYLGDCHTPLLNCLISLAAHTPQFLSQEGMTDDVAAQVVTHLSAGAAPLLTHLLADSLFVKSYFQRADELQSSASIDNFGYCNLTNLILKKLIPLSVMDEEVKDLWFHPNFPLVETVFKILHFCPDLFFNYNEDTYQALLTHTAAFTIATSTSDEFPIFEKMLIRHLLQPALWPAVFSSDIMCLIVRVGSSRLCMQLTTLLSDLCSSWPPWDRCRPEWEYISWTMRRLIFFLADNDLKAFPSLLPDMKTIGHKLNTIFNQPFSDQSAEIYDFSFQRLMVLRDHVGLFPDAKASLVGLVCQLWEHMSPDSSDWLCSLYSVLVTLTSHCVDSLDNHQIGNVLNVLEKAIVSSSIVFKCGACEFLRSLADKNFANDNNKALICNKISLLFGQLLQDRMCLVKQSALEAFSFFAYLTKYEEIVANTVASDKELQDKVTLYLKGVPIVISKTEFLKHIGSLNSEFVHKCTKSTSYVNKKADVELNPCKKLKTSSSEESILGVLQRIEKELDMITDLTNCERMSQCQLSVLKSISTRIDDIIKTYNLNV